MTFEEFRDMYLAHANLLLEKYPGITGEDFCKHAYDDLADWQRHSNEEVAYKFMQVMHRKVGKVDDIILRHNIIKLLWKDNMPKIITTYSLKDLLDVIKVTVRELPFHETEIALCRLYNTSYPEIPGLLDLLLLRVSNILCPFYYEHKEDIPLEELDKAFKKLQDYFERIYEPLDDSIFEKFSFEVRTNNRSARANLKFWEYFCDARKNPNKKKPSRKGNSGPDETGYLRDQWSQIKKQILSRFLI